MSESQESILLELERKMQSIKVASYFIGQYYFAVNTRKSRIQFDLLPDSTIDLEIQQKMQRENIISLFHEYIHYIHEISTVVGNVGLGLDVCLKSIFSNYFDMDLQSCKHLGVDRTDRARFSKFCKIYTTTEIFLGAVEQDTTILQVLNIHSQLQNIDFPVGDDLTEFPIDLVTIEVQVHENGQYKNRNLFFGKFFIYEGLAYELDRELERQLTGSETIRDHLRFSEYTLLRLVAKFIFPEIDTQTFLSLASLSLSYIDCGNSFIRMLRKMKESFDEGNDINITLTDLKNHVREILFNKYEHFRDSYSEIVSVFEHRTQLKRAFSIIGENAKSGYRERIKKPDFEVEYIFSGRYQELLDIIPVCDYMYTFLDEEEFNRDFLGTTSLNKKDSSACKVLIAYDHYQTAHSINSTDEVEQTRHTKCPFYTCCNLSLRQAHAGICSEKPWRIFEISSQSDRQYCWYGQAVGEFKGHSE